MRGAPLENKAPIRKSLTDYLRIRDCQFQPSRCRRTKGEAKVKRQTNAARRPATLEPHRSWTFAACLPAAFGSGTTAPIRQHSPSERHIYQCGCRAAIPGITTQQLLRLASSPTRLTEREEKEAAMPGQPACARALPIFPRQFTLENRRSAASLAAIIVASPGRSYVFAEPNCAADCCASQPKSISPLCRNCGGWDFLVEG